jgi:hypothetical protein
VDPGELRQALVSRVMQSSRGGLKGTVIMWVEQQGYLCPPKRTDIDSPSNQYDNSIDLLIHWSPCDRLHL